MGCFNCGFTCQALLFVWGVIAAIPVALTYRYSQPHFLYFNPNFKHNQFNRAFNLENDNAGVVLFGSDVSIKEGDFVKHIGNQSCRSSCIGEDCFHW